MNTRTPVIIGQRQTLHLFQLGGFQAYALEDHSLDDICADILRHSSKIGVIILTSQVSLTEKQQKTLEEQDIPLLTLPLTADEDRHAEANFEQLVKRAIGMDIDFLKK